MSWSDWNWEAIGTAAMIIGGLVVFLSVNRWGPKSHVRNGLGSNIFLPPEKYFWFPSLRKESDAGFGINPATGSVMLDHVDINGNTFGSSDND